MSICCLKKRIILSEYSAACMFLFVFACVWLSRSLRENEFYTCFCAPAGVSYAALFMWRSAYVIRPCVWARVHCKNKQNETGLLWPSPFIIMMYYRCVMAEFTQPRVLACVYQQCSLQMFQFFKYCINESQCLVVLKLQLRVWVDRGHLVQGWSISKLINMHYSDQKDYFWSDMIR